ncbi:hypothetical protein SAMN05444722_2165 [Rhodovulum sp. ES.010]|uniref:hypothetical protein n=1 Tax=Rhodovulum sp. ES.010 TaxID=1882821 RepID=UPI0009265E04|nr:hypothetical protein [Rhodovulum sp. ES.010]SIO44053.1 hypothetical protein SAMN05444722_2165 [Rhodovulum sp. ES.010]
MRRLGQAIFGAMSLAATSAMGATLSGFGTASVDGVIAPGEWNPAGSVNFLVNTPGGGTAAATLWAMNDRVNLYLGVEIAGTYDLPDVNFEFDVDGDATTSDGDDAVVVNTTVGYRDSVRTSDPAVCPVPGPCGVPDPLVGGVVNGTAAIDETLLSTVFEVVKPLDSGDPNDFALTTGDTIGLYTFVRLIDTGVGQADTRRFYPTDSIAIAPVPGPASLGLLGSAIGLGLIVGGFRRRGTPSLPS